MNKSFLFIFFFLYLCSHSVYENDVQEIFGKVRIIDGDSIEINNNHKYESEKLVFKIFSKLISFFI